MRIGEALFHILFTGILTSIFYTLFSWEINYFWIFIAFLFGGILRMIFILILDVKKEKTQNE